MACARVHAGREATWNRTFLPIYSERGANGPPLGR